MSGQMPGCRCSPGGRAEMGRTEKEHSASRTIFLAIQRAEVQALSEDRGPSTGAVGSSLSISGPSVCVTETVDPSGLFRLWEPKAPQGVAEYVKVRALAGPPSRPVPHSVYFIWGSCVRFCLEKYLLLPSSLKISRLDDLVGSKCPQIL